MKKKINLYKKERSIYLYWKKNKLFKPNIKTNNKKNFSIIMPPPNITGRLHIGHAFQQTIMDVIIRYKKMSGYNTLWLMGTDHAGISTQIIVENNIKKNYINKKISKKKIIREIWKWKSKYEKKIYKQTEILGSSVDLSKTCFSLDKNFTKSVQKVFIYLYKKKLIYKNKKAIYWDKKIKSVLSDLEINKENKIKKNYFIKFKILNKKKYLIIETTKPEMILGITALAVNNKDNKLIGKKIINPLTNNIIKIIYNKNIIFSKKKIYTKIIPGHRINHLNLCKKFNLDIINILDKNGFFKKKIYILNKKFKKKNIKINIIKIFKLKKLNYNYVKKKIVKFLKNKKIILKIEKKKSSIYLSNKTNSKPIIIITNQWYLKTKPLAKKAIYLIKKNKIVFIPSKYKKLFFKWMENIQDWCISRQIYWGHKIPIWYDKNKKIYIGSSKKKILSKYKINTEIKQDKNILDTWFSSSIWSFTSLGWPKDKNLLKKFYPINLIVSGIDIIFFWISRMIMITSYLSKKFNYLNIPFKKVFLTGLIRDENGNKMSKSVGNVIDPLDIIYGIKLNKLIKKRTKNVIKKKKIKSIINDTKKNFPNGIKRHSVDILRHTLCSISTSKLKINFDVKKLTHSYNYCNKIWNTYRYVLKNFNFKSFNNKINENKLNLIEHWILNKTNNLIKKFKLNIKKLRFDLLSQIIFQFIKNNFCDWYIELNKILIKKKKFNTNNKSVLYYLIKTILKLTHPITPFITEYLWKKIYKKSSILKEKFPKTKNYLNNIENSKIFIKIQKIIIFIRKTNNKSERKITHLIILNIDLNHKNIFIKNKYLFNFVNIKKILFLKNKKNNILKLQNKNIKKITINNIDILYY